MRRISFSCPKFGYLEVVGDRLHSGDDFLVKSNADNAAFDYLIFLDSRGVGREIDHSLVEKLVARIIEQGRTYLVICRPLELTTWATLIGFLSVNQLSPTKIITNMGFVDFTPKKLSVLQSTKDQAHAVLGKDVAESFFVEDFILSAGNSVPLYSMRYSGQYRAAIESIAARYLVVVINTPLTSPKIAIERKRPLAFFSAQAESNAFNRSITGVKVIDLPEFDESLTYDAVHYTQRGSEVIFDRVKDCL